MILSHLTFIRESSSRILLESGARSHLSNFVDLDFVTSATLIADTNVYSFHGSEVRDSLEHLFGSVTVITVPPGEGSKTRDTVAKIQDRLSEEKVDRRGLVVGLGGGVTLDIAGYVAATYLRGIPWIAMPTSLLAQVDAGIGGKTGVNTSKGKNLAGAFHPPLQVIIDPEVLNTLPLIEWRNGLVEAVKHAWIADADLFSLFENTASSLKSGPDSHLHDWLNAAIQVKISVVAEDPFELGKRSILNAGHTVGHAIEAATDHAIRHGFAVARGLVVESRAAGERTGLPVDHIRRLEHLLEELEVLPPTNGIDFDSLLPFLLRDKKNQRDHVRISLPASLGRSSAIDGSWTIDVQPDALRHAWESFQ
ncbi:MAG: 3-dehydroquinate synthase [bacterium]